MVRAFLRWWLGQLADLLPERWHGPGAAADAAILSPSLSEPEPAVAVSLRHNRQETPLGRFRLGSETAELARLAGKRAVLRLGAGDVLGKTLALPLAAERQLDQVLAFEMDRETPFAADEVFWSCRVLRRDRRTGQLWVRLWLVPRARLAGLLQALGTIGVRPQRAEFGDGAGGPAFIPLDPAGGPHGTARPRLLRPALACCAALALAVVATPFIRQGLVMAEVERGLAADRAAAAETQKLRREIDRLSGNMDLIAAERAQGGRPLSVLAELTSLLPSDTYLTDFAQQRGKVTLTGRSATASRLIALLAAAEHLRNPSFAAPVTRIAANQPEIFTIAAEVVP